MRGTVIYFSERLSVKSGERVYTFISNSPPSSVEPPFIAAESVRYFTVP
jgi:hypothetical protein